MDYQAVSNFTLTIAASQTSGTGTFEFTPISDGAAESDETVRLSGSTTDLGSATADLTITEAAATGFTLGVNPASVAEGAGATTVTVTATLNGAALETATEVTVSDAGTGSATTAVDYQAVSNFTLTIDDERDGDVRRERRGDGDGPGETADDDHEAAATGFTLGVTRRAWRRTRGRRR